MNDILPLRPSRLFALAASVTAWLSCGMPTPDQPADDGVDPWRAHCTESGPARAQTCNDSFDTDDCLDFGACLAEIARADVLAPIASCLDARACDEGDDPCFDPAALGLETIEAATVYRDDCVAKLQTCDPSERYSADFCEPSILSDATIAQLRACLAEDCTSYRTCFLAIAACK